MADQNQQMADIMQQVNFELERYGRLTGSTADALRDAKVGVEGFSQAVRKVPIALTDSVGRMVKTLNTGERGAKAYNDAVSSMADAASAATTVLTAMIPGGPVVKMLVMGLGKLASAAIKAASEVYKLAAEQGDLQYNAFQALARAGAAAAGGTTQFAKDLYKTGVVLQDLDGYVRLIGENSQDLALFAGSVSRGVEDFTNLTSAMKPFRAELERLGLNTEQQREAIMRFVSMQTRLGNAGRLQAQSYEMQAAAAKRYIEEQDVLTRLTGVERKEREKALMDAMRNQRFAATLDDLERRGRTQEANNLRTTFALFRERIGEEGAKGFSDLISGIVGTPEARKVLMLTGGAALEEIERQKAGLVKTDRDLANSYERVEKAAAETAVSMNTLGQVGAFDSIFGAFSEARNADIRQRNKDMDLDQQIFKERQNQAKIQAGVDERLANQSKTRINQLDAQLEKEKLVDRAVTAVTKASLLASDALLKVAQAANSAADGLLGVKQEAKGFWDKILEFFGIGPRPKTQQELALEAQEKAAREAMERAEAERRTLTAARKTAEADLDAERKRLRDAQAAERDAKQQLQKQGKATGPAAEAERARLEKNVINQGLMVEAAKLGIEQRAKTVADARKREADAALAEEKAVRQRLIAQGREATGGQSLDPAKAAERDRERRQREQDIETLKAKEIELRQQQENLKRNVDTLGKLDKTQDKDKIELLTRVNKVVTDRVKTLEKESQDLRTKIQASKAAATPPAATTGASAAPVSAINMNQDQLAAMGIKIKKGDVQAAGAGIDPRVLKLARNIQDNLKEFEVFTGFNDNYHQESATGSLHTRGLAMDFTLKKQPTVEEGRKIVEYIKGLGASRVIDEYNFPSGKSTGGHIHAEVGAFAKGGIISAPTIALMGERQSEAVVPLPDGKSIPVSMDNSMLADLAQSIRAMADEFRTAIQNTANQSSDSGGLVPALMTELLREQRTNNNLTQKMLQYARN